MRILLEPLAWRRRRRRVRRRPKPLASSLPKTQTERDALKAAKGGGKTKLPEPETLVELKI